MSINTVDSTPPPKIGKIGPYTVFITPPPTPTTPNPNPIANSNSNSNSTPSPKPVSPQKTVTAPPSPMMVQSAPPPVQAPPMQMPKSAAKSHSETFGFFWDAVAKVQNAHESLDEHVAHWFGLNQSKYQWALDDYYESKGINQKDAELKDASNKV